jgi:hypothetical protein
MELDALIGRCLEKDPAARPQSIAEMASALDGVLVHMPWTRGPDRRLVEAELGRRSDPGRFRFTAPVRLKRQKASPKAGLLFAAVLLSGRKRWRLPTPVSERISCAGNRARSLAACALLSSLETGPDHREGRRHREDGRRGVGEHRRALGVAQRGFPHAGDMMVSATEEIRPTVPPATAPLVVQSFHSTDMNSTGKLAEQATAKASITMKATFSFSNTMPSSTAKMPRQTVVIFDTRSSVAESTLP